jgi:glycosyltransferase involved in cell wall biosynthesis
LISFGSTNPFTGALSSLDVEKRHLGYISSPNRMAQIYSTSDVFVFPSKTENYPLSLLESIACKTPVAAFKVGGVPEIVTSSSFGLLAKPYDTKQLARNIVSLLGRRTDRISVPKDFSIRRSAKEYLKLFRAITL